MDDDINSPERCVARASDPEWQAEQVRKNEAAAQAYNDYREEIGVPLFQKGRLVR